MSASSPIPEDVRRDLERMAGPLAERMLPPKVTQSATTRNVVAAVNDDGTVDVMMGGAVMQRVPATTACAGVAVGDEVIVAQHGPRLYCVGVVAATLGARVLWSDVGVVAATLGARVLWSDAGGWYMHAGQTARLSEPVSAQRTGIVLHWQGHTPEEGVRDYQHNYQLVPTSHVRGHAGRGVGSLLVAGARLVMKYVYVFDDRVTGNDMNKAAEDTISGIQVDNRYQVLTEILGV